ncbi:MAG: hypothetical protein ACFNYB_06480 [Campylobacter sp.]
MAYNQEAQDDKAKQEVEAIEQVLTDIRKRLRAIGKAGHSYDLLGTFNSMMNKEVDKFFNITYNPDLFSEFKILTHFYQLNEAKEEILTAFVDFFRNIREAKANKDAIVVRYENYLKAIELLKHAFYFGEDFTGELFINDPFGRYYDPTPEYDTFIKSATGYFEPFKKQKDRYDLLNNTQKIRDKFSNTLILKAEMYQIIGIDKNKKATLANKIYKYFYPSDKDA